MDAAALLTIARLEARVSSLEKKLAERSAWIRAFARDAREEDLIRLTRAILGLPPLPRPGFGLRGWSETTALSSGDVEATMTELWRSLTPFELSDGESPADQFPRGSADGFSGTAGAADVIAPARR
jgi:hypothetical protein